MIYTLNHTISLSSHWQTFCHFSWTFKLYLFIAHHTSCQCRISIFWCQTD